MNSALTKIVSLDTFFWFVPLDPGFYSISLELFA